MQTDIQKKHNLYFKVGQDTQLGAFSFREGEPLKVVGNAGQFYVYAEWGEGAIGPLTAEKVNELAGCQVVTA